jgi:hypothetical protein
MQFNLLKIIPGLGKNYLISKLEIPPKFSIGDIVSPYD